MAVFRCKMCGGNLNVTEGMTVCECEYCGSRQTIPIADNEKKMTLFARANRLLRNCEFDKASSVFEGIVADFPEEAEAYWGLILCKYGIEYVDDPVTGRKVPTCHRSSFDSVMDDPDFELVMEYADPIARKVYREQAKEIEQIRKGIVEVSGKEPPYDIFICYKETASDGQRTLDSVLAQDVYDALTAKGYRVFFSRISLEDRLGTEYEPCIFAALNSAKVMLAFGTDYEYFDAVWVKNEWSRFLKLMEKDKTKHLIPCFRNIALYDIPKEFARLQAQDFGKVGAVQDLLRGIEKIIRVSEPKEAVKEKETIVYQQGNSGTTAAAQIKRGNMALEDHDWVKADSFFEEALNLLDPECAEAYSGKLLAKDKTPDFMSWIGMQKEKYSSAVTERLEACPADTAHITKIVKEYVLAGYLDEAEIRKEYEYDLGYDSVLSCRRSQKAEQLKELAAERLLTRAKQHAKGAAQKQIESGLAEITAVLDQRIAEAQEQDRQSIARVKASYEAHLAEADKKAEELNRDARNRRERCYQSAVNLMKEAGDVPGFEKAAAALKAMNGYKDSSDLAVRCQEEINRIQKELKETAEKKRRKAKIRIMIVAAAVIIRMALTLISVKAIILNGKYNAAVALKESGDYEAALSAFEALNGYRDSADQIEQCSAIVTPGKIAGFANVSAGDTIVYGSYEQDNNASNGKEGIEWNVLAREGNQILVVSRYALDCRQYHTSDFGVTWEDCLLREWLNSTFLSDAFTEAEQAYIPTVTVTADRIPVYSTSAGNDTQDQVFLLSITEAEKYFSSDTARQCEATAYAEAQGAYTFSSNGTYCWWLRTLVGYYQHYAAYVGDDGSLGYGGCYVLYDHNAVRPALWINLES